MLGTVLPTKASIAANNVYAKQVEREKSIIASKCLTHCERRLVGDEVRYYDTTDQYAIVARTGKVLWFAVRPDGDYRIN